jgi:hypothetical protein
VEAAKNFEVTMSSSVPSPQGPYAVEEDPGVIRAHGHGHRIHAQAHR